MNNVMGVINIDYEQTSLQELTLYRSVSSVPFGGRYRFIDFPLSSLVNSGISNVSILLNDRYTSLMDHLKNGKAWDLSRKRDGLFLLPPIENIGKNKNKSDIWQYYYHLDYFYRSTQEYVVLIGSQVLMNINYQDIYHEHIESSADITMLFTDQDNYRSHQKYRVNKAMKIADDNKVIAVGESVAEASDKVYLNTLIIKKSLFIELIESAMVQGKHDFLTEVIAQKVNELNVVGYEFTSYCAPIYCVLDYYHHSLALLDNNIRRSLFQEPAVIFTKVKDEPPARYMTGAQVSNSLIANGCHIQGSVYNSILFRGVKVHKGAKIVNSIIMQRCEVSENAVLENVILDKEVFVARNSKINGQEDAPNLIARRMFV